MYVSFITKLFFLLFLFQSAGRWGDPASQRVVEAGIALLLSDFWHNYPGDENRDLLSKPLQPDS